MIRYDWDKSYKEIGLVFEPRIVRVLNDERLRLYLKRGGRKAASELAAMARELYQTKYGCPLEITTRSLACEIYWHYYINEKALYFEKRRGLKKLSRWLIFHMDVIDCGERSEDNNRFLWDFLGVVF